MINETKAIGKNTQTNRQKGQDTKTEGKDKGKDSQ
jgi:hypothetical protein